MRFFKWSKTDIRNWIKDVGFFTLITIIVIAVLAGAFFGELYANKKQSYEQAKEEYYSAGFSEGYRVGYADAKAGK